MSKEAARAENRFHVIVARHHLRAIVADMVPRQHVSLYTEVMKTIELLSDRLEEESP